MKKKLLLTLLALLSVVLCSQATVIVSGKAYNLNTDDQTAELTRTSYSGSIAIPSSIRYNGTTYYVTSIGDFAFSDCTSLTYITIPSSVTSIGERAFWNCTSLTSVTIPSSVKTIGSGAFSGCNALKSISIPSSVTSIGSSAFSGCNKLTSISIPNSVTSIGGWAFSSCSGLTSITIPNSITSIGEYTFYNCSGLTSVNIPSSVTSIGNKAFSGCNKLTSISLPSSVSSIGEWAFYDCKGLTSISMPSVIFVGEHAFSGTPWLDNKPWQGVIYAGKVAIDCKTTSTSIIIEQGTVSIADRAFATGGASNVTSITIPNSVTSIGSLAFNGCNKLTSITIPSSVTNIGYNSFYGTPWFNNKPDGLLYINNIAYTYKGTMPANTSITIQQGTLKIADSAFKDCNTLTYISIPSSVTSIGETAFWNCTSLTSVTIPNSVTSIGNYAFQGCSGLTSVTIPNSVTEIGDGTFNDCTSLRSVTIPNSVKIIGSSAFERCNALKSISIPSSVTSIGTNAFYFCTGLTSVNIPNSVTNIGNYAFQGCSSLKSVNIPNSLTCFRSSIFSGCSSLTSVNIPNSLTYFYPGVFSGCSSLIRIKAENTTPVYLTSSNPFSNSSNATLYIPMGCSASYTGADYWKDFKAIKEYPNNDVNEDNITDVVDVVDIARFVVGTPRNAFVEFLADINSDNMVNVADAVVLVNEIAGNTQFAKPALAPKKAVSDVLTLFGNGNNLSLQVEGTRDYTAFQFDLWLPADMDLMQVLLNDARRQGHQLLYNKMGDGHYRVVALSTSGNVFNGTSGELLSITLDDFVTDDVRIDNIHFVTARGIDVPFEAIGVNYVNDGVTTDIRSVDSNNTIIQPVYNLNGQRLAAPRKGLNIIGGKKIVVK